VLNKDTTGTVLYRLWYDAVLGWVLNRIRSQHSITRLSRRRLHAVNSLSIDMLCWIFKKKIHSMTHSDADMTLYVQ